MNIQIIDHIDVAVLAAGCVAKDRLTLWDQNKVRQEYAGTAHKATRTIFLRGPLPLSLETWFEDVPSEDYEALKEWKAAQNVLAKISKRVRNLNNLTLRVKGHAMLVELQPGAGLDWHVDQGDYAEKHCRFHVPLITNPGSFLCSGGAVLHPEVGSLVMFNNHTLHTAVNFGVHRRIHLIVDYRIEA